VAAHAHQRPGGLRRYIQGLLNDSHRKSIEAMRTWLGEPAPIKRSRTSSRMRQGRGATVAAIAARPRSIVSCCRAPRGPARRVSRL
jgi:hypothetical protein